MSELERVSYHVISVNATDLARIEQMAEVVKQETTVGVTDSEGREDTEDEEVDIVFDSWVVRLDLMKCGDIESHPGPQRYA